MQTGTFGIGVVGVFNRTLPPRSKIIYDPGYELALEVKRWFHYRHDLIVNVTGDYINDPDHLQRTMIEGYKRILRSKMRYWDVLQIAVMGHVNEFKEIYKDVLGEMEFTRQA